MNNDNMKPIIILTIILSLSFISAVTYSGESFNITNVSQPYESYSIVGNSTEVSLNVSQEGDIITIILDKYMKTDSFKIIFFGIEKEVIKVYSGGGGSSRIVYRDKEVIVEVDNYLDRVVEVEIPGEEKIIDKEVIINEVPSWLLGILMVSSIIWLLLGYWVYRNRTSKKEIIPDIQRDENIDERRFKNE